MVRSVVDEVAGIMHITSKAMGMGRRKILGVSITFGIPEKEFRKFLEDPASYQGAGAPEIIEVAKLLCIASKFYAENICPFLGSGEIETV